MSHLQSDATVSELIYVNTGWWNISLIHNIFNSIEANSICSLALSPGGQPDKLTWLGTSSGVLTVRNAYHLEKERVLHAQGECSMSADSREFWKKLWHLNIPGVVQHFLWRVCNNLLPTEANLFKRKIVQDPLCPMCGLLPESTGHILWECASSIARGVDGMLLEDSKTSHRSTRWLAFVQNATGQA